MHQAIDARFQALENRRRALIASVRALPEAKQTAKASRKEFSPVETIMHMAEADQIYVDELKRTPPTILKARSAHPTFVFRRVVSTLNAGTTVPAIGKLDTKTSATIDEGAAAWDQTAAALATFLQQIESPEAAFVKRFPFGVMSAADLLELLEAHMSYHEARVRR